MVERPTSVVRAVRLVWLLVGLALVVTVLAVVFDDELVAAWAGDAGLSADDTRVPPSFTPVVVVLYVVVASLALVLTAFVQGGHNWARHTLAAMVVFVFVSTVGGLRVGPPAFFVVGSVVTLVVEVLILVLLYRPDTSAYVGPKVPRRTTSV